jgi:hypothetical protein
MKKMRQGTSPVIQIMGQRTVPWWLRYMPSRIQFLDDFEGVLKWSQEAGTVTKDSSIHAYEGTYCLKLATAATAGSLAQARLVLGIIPLSKVMLQLRWHYTAAAVSTPRSFILTANIYDETYQTYIGLQHLNYVTTAQNKWQYLGSDMAWHDLPDGSQIISPTLPTHQYLMLKADLKSNPPKYVMAELNNKVIDMSALQAYRTTTSGSPRILIDLAAYTDAAAETDVYVDAFCFSDQEP